MTSGLRGVRTRVGQAVLEKVLALSPDTRERHAIVGRLAGTPRTVLDVGGVPGLLTPYLPRGTQLVTANVEPPADILLHGTNLPVEMHAFDLVTSLDVLEHVRPRERAAFVAELVRVADRRVILCCPLGSPEHSTAEQQLLEWCKRTTGEDHRWLAEHIENGLPSDEELRNAFSPWMAADSEAHVEFFYHGDFRVSEAQFKQMASAMGDGPTAKVTLAWTWFRQPRDLRLSDHPTPWTNRVFVRWERPSTS